MIAGAQLAAAAPEQHTQTVRMRLLTEQPLGKRGVQNPREPLSYAESLGHAASVPQTTPETDPQPRGTSAARPPVAQSVERHVEDVFDQLGLRGDLRDPADHLDDLVEVRVGAHDAGLLGAFQ